MTTELLLTEVIKSIAPLVFYLLKGGINTIIEASAEGKNLGMCEIHGSKNTCSEVHLNRFGGRPQNRNEFKVSSITAGGFVWKLYLKNAGNWYHRFGGGSGAKVYECDLYIHGPLCPHDSSHTRFKLHRKWFWRRWVCEHCNTVVYYKKTDKVNKIIAKQLRKKMILEFRL